MKRFTKTSLIAASAKRLPGYVDAVLEAAAQQDDTNVWLDDAAYESLREQFTPKTPLPLIRKAKNFAASAAKHLAAGMPMCTEEQVAERFAICQGCEFLKDNACTKCGCPVNREKRFISKLSWANEKCPIGKWGAIVSKESSDAIR